MYCVCDTTDVDGGNPELYLAAGPENAPYGIALDELTDTLFVAFPFQDKILAFDLSDPNGAANPLVFADGLDFVYSLTLVPIPEPASVTLLVLASVILLARHRGFGRL